MSQITSFGNGGGGGGGDLNTLTGNTGGAVSPTGGNINIVGMSPLTVTGTPGISTLQVIDSSRNNAMVITNDATPTTLFSLTLGTDSVVAMQAMVSAGIDDFSAGAACVISFGARNDGSGAVLIGVPDVSLAEDFPSPISIDGIVSGNNMIIEVTGIAAREITWNAIITQVTTI
jgi:hypothetical protein